MSALPLKIRPVTKEVALVNFSAFLLCSFRSLIFRRYSLVTINIHLSPYHFTFTCSPLCPCVVRFSLVLFFYYFQSSSSLPLSLLAYYSLSVSHSLTLINTRKGHFRQTNFFQTLPLTKVLQRASRFRVLCRLLATCSPEFSDHFILYFLVSMF